MSHDPAEIHLEYLEALDFEPYPVQEQALEAWFSDESGAKDGIMLCAPTGTGKTLIAEAAAYQALRDNKTCYLTTPLIALTDQKFQDLQAKTEAWGFNPNDIGLITGNRSVNPHAKVRVVVAEVLLNRLLDAEQYDFDKTQSVVMDECHLFADKERGIVWELSMTLLPKHIRMLLLSATVGNAYDFTSWLRVAHDRHLRLVQSDHRHIPLSYHWHDDLYLPQLLEHIGQRNHFPALVFAFDRNQCWDIGEQCKGLKLSDEATRKRRLDFLETHPPIGCGAPKLKRLLAAGVGIHHAGLLASNRLLVETMFLKKLLPICVCTETLAAGLNLPARSVIMSRLAKGPYKKQKIIDPSSAQQMFGRAGRPQFDTEGHVYTLPHDDDIKRALHKQKIRLIPEDTKDPKLRMARKKLEKKMPKRREDVRYWNEADFTRLYEASSRNLASHALLPYKWLAHLLEKNTDYQRLLTFTQQRMNNDAGKQRDAQELKEMLVAMHHQEMIALEPAPPSLQNKAAKQEEILEDIPQEPLKQDDLAAMLSFGGGDLTAPASASKSGKTKKAAAPTHKLNNYTPGTIKQTRKLSDMTHFRSMPPMYACWLMNHAYKANIEEWLQICESVLEISPTVARQLRPINNHVPIGPLSADIIDPIVMQHGVYSHEELYPPPPEKQDRSLGPIRWPIQLGEKAFKAFAHDTPYAKPIKIVPIWAAGALITGDIADFDQLIRTRDLQTQEGVVHRHLLRTILLLDEWREITPPNTDADQWHDTHLEWIEKLENICHIIDPHGTQQWLENR